MINLLGCDLIYFVQKLDLPPLHIPPIPLKSLKQCLKEKETNLSIVYKIPTDGFKKKENLPTFG